MCNVKGYTHITALSNNGVRIGESLCKVLDNKGKRKTFNIERYFVFICACVIKSTVNGVVCAVIHLFSFNLHAIGLPDRNAYCVTQYKNLFPLS
jgi:hypothetical protein